MIDHRLLQNAKAFVLMGPIRDPSAIGLQFILGNVMLIDQGDIILVSHRRMFERDESRFFLGRTIASEGPLLKAEGYSFVRDLSNGMIIKKQEKRIKLVSLDSPGHIVYQLPGGIDVDAVGIESGNGDAYMVEGKKRLLNLSERSHCGHF